MREVANLSQHAITWFLTRLGHELNIGQDTKAYKNGVETLRKNLTKITNECLTQGIEERQRMNEQNGLPKDLAHHIALMPILSSACDLIRISLEQESNLIDTAQTYFQLGDRFHMDWLRQQARYLHSDDHWQKEATNGLVDQLYSCQAGMTIRVLHDTNCKKKQGKSLLDCWMDMHPNLSKQFDPLFAELRRAGSIDLPMLVIAEQRLRALYGG